MQCDGMLVVGESLPPRAMNKSNNYKLALALLLLAGAVFFYFRFSRNKDGISERTFFYDLNEKKLFAASRESLSPIRGLNKVEDGAVRAIVISASGDPHEEASRK